MLLMLPIFVYQKWFHLKMLGLLVLLVYHFFSGYVRRRFKKGDFFISERTCRIMNEIPTLCLILMVIVVVLKPI
jgi:putative membrane protein